MNSNTYKVVVLFSSTLLSNLPFGFQLEEAKLFRAQGQNLIAINLAMYISQNYRSNEEASDAFRLVGKWLAETRSSKL